MTLATDGIEKLHVALDHRSYDIHVGEGVIERAGSILAPLLRSPRAVVITDELVAPHWLQPLSDSLTAAKIAHRTITLPPGEQTKSFAELGALMDNLLSVGIDRKTTIIALGGGVIGDLSGFAAAIALRGIDFVQVPTTLLSQVDSSVGGKTGIDTPHGKNLIGAFHQPRAVLADTAVLNTLPKRELLCGYAEVVKYGIINDRAFFDWLCEHGQALLDGDPARRREAVMRSCANKAQIVAADEREVGLRALLNLGHTFGHALEAEVGFGDTLKHGEAVAIGIVMALDLSVRLALCSEEDRNLVVDHFAAVGLPTTLDGLVGDDWTADRLLDHMGRDKKTEGGRLTFILARAIGHSFVAPDVDTEAVSNVLNDFILEARA